MTSLGGYDHSVLDTFVQLTEGRSARDLPKQPPAKKIVAWILTFCLVVLFGACSVFLLRVHFISMSFAI